LRERFGYWMQEAASGSEVLVTRHRKPLIRLVPARRPAPTAPVA